MPLTRPFIPALVLAFAAAWSAHAQNWEPHLFKAADGTTVQAEKGWIEAPEDRDDPRSRRIRLHFVRFKSTAARPGAPIVYLAGGPGGSGIEAARGKRFPIFMALREAADVIALDQRGAGESNAVPFCPASRPLLEFTREAATAHVRAEFDRCWDWWGAQGVAIGGYDTWQSAADLEDLRRALGAERLNLWGISYGTHLAFAALKRQPERIERVALASLEGPDQTVRHPSTYDAYLARVAALAAADPVAGKAFPDLLGTMRRVHAKLDADPVAVTFAPRPGADPVTVRLGAFAAQAAVGQLIADPETVAQIPLLYAALDAGLYEPLARQVHARLAGSRAGLQGMPEAMDRASGVSRARLDRVQREAPAALLSDATTFPMPQIADLRPEADLGERFREAGRIRTPALLVMGTLDGRTPAEEQRDAARAFSNATVLTVVNAGHNVWEAHPDLARRLLAFFQGRRPDDTPLTLPPPRFATP